MTEKDPPPAPLPAIVDWAAEVVFDETEKTTEPLLRTTEPKGTCYPHKLDVNQKRRKVTCAKCGLEFTHWDALVYIVRDYDAYGANLRSVKADVDRLLQTREVLRKQVQALKAMAKRRLGR